MIADIISNSSIQVQVCSFSWTFSHLFKCWKNFWLKDRGM